MSRQNYYQQRSLRSRESIDESLVLELVRRERCLHPQIGCRKLLGLLKADLQSAQVKIGRDRFFALLGREDLLIERKPNYARTTNSWHGFGVYPNLAKDLTLTGPDQLLVSDITYIRTLEGFMFLSLVMDSFSRAIVGYDSSDSLEMQGALRALSMAQRQLPRSRTIRTVHHSDRGSQYCCGPYIAQLESKKMSISMTEQNHCYENSQAERLNGILKQEYGLGELFKSKSSVPAAVREAVSLYNEYRPHGALGNRVPMSVHRQAAVRGARPPGLRPGSRAPRRIMKSQRCKR